MRKLDRASVKIPPSLANPHAAVSAEKTEAVSYYGARTPWTATYSSFSFKHYKARDVKAALRQLAGGNCAYCESKIGAVGAREVEHYRPKGGIDGTANHPGYWWLAHNWNNLLPTCRDCNKSLRQHIVAPGMTRAQVEDILSRTPKGNYGKATQFAIRGVRAVSDSCSLEAEDPLLIDPCRRDPGNELRWDFSTELTLIEPKEVEINRPSLYGEYTIKTCGLNRAELVLDRIPTLRPMRTLRTHIINRLNQWDGSQVDLDDIMKEVEVLTAHAHPEQPYAGMAAAYIRDFEEELNRWRAERGFPTF
ncbi:hypothetical protein [Burkholderia sp. Ac-20353]|uniref:hypothetical protein n=1 Tax=Burkholderia sp. Ac-20353 TaxID=2703894 RepID=UPI00197BF884|nr:hypothetical protein [Burkholderia sp. Ac-20353]MBN3786187.1 hypothetical protein [Burkholderia sp. Ac-20353]